jgi:anthranilate synthase component 1
VLRPSQDEFAKLAERGNVIPLVREIAADLDTPLSLFRRLDDGANAFLFESVQGGEKWARWSFMGTGARTVFESRAGDARVIEGGAERRFRIEGDPLVWLREKLAALRPAFPDGPPLPRFAGGAVGAIAWDWVRYVERVPDANPDELGFPDVRFVLPETVVAFDNVRHVALVIREVELAPGDDARARWREAAAALEATVATLRAPLAHEAQPAVTQAMSVAGNLTRDAYHGIVKRAKEYIEAGDIFQVVLSQRFTLPLQVEPFLIYRQLRRINPSPYLFFLRAGEDRILIGSSPEILVRMEGGKIDLRPIAGTRPRGASAEADRALEAELLADPKERAEHLMLVDLGRNDVGRVARTGSVHVSEYATVERYSHVMHIVSNVQGELRPGLDWLDLLRASFPAGTLSGAPKVRAMEIIDELETVRRGPYGGCVGYVDHSGNMDMAIAIRTMLVQGGSITVQSGGGVVADSDPEGEYQETLHKGRALIQAIDLAREGSD